ncbi:Sulfur carrier protein ThiS (thiamine biosynthesis) [Desulfacinum hydrothermale DSM 13146]|uniref:Sulfur carrier protein ThiS (Thiamine biosynthesis) n=1 Tax=Desulfacinum hydrothermale DSM 13146 TaxID=1121390 RepID=A0A1W1XDD7_9BACT|nr:MoaD/ThiS family protein [Desulfacinum hydrothermale]SMC21946.1 Sulfur carrier protein ThiS (thiamine biosynthesis) [Desulfacinum hydrothermale DSM 13146]
MKIRVESFATYRDYTERLPQDKQMDVPDGAVIQDVLAALGVPTDKPIILLVNGRARPAHAPLREGDHLVFFPPLEGG